MLFLGLGTGLGAANDRRQCRPADGSRPPSLQNGKSFEDYVGERGLEKRGKKKVAQTCLRRRRPGSAPPCSRTMSSLRRNVDKLDELPADSRRGDNTRAFEAGFACGATRR